MCGDRFSSSTTCSKWRHETEPGRLDQSLSCRFWEVATHPFEAADDLAFGPTVAGASRDVVDRAVAPQVPGTARGRAAEREPDRRRAVRRVHADRLGEGQRPPPPSRARGAEHFDDIDATNWSP